MTSCNTLNIVCRHSSLIKLKIGFKMFFALCNTKIMNNIYYNTQTCPQNYVIIFLYNSVNLINLFLKTRTSNQMCGDSEKRGYSY